MRHRSILLFIGLCIASIFHAQAPQRATSGELFNEIQKLRVLGSVLYVAAHPDDENTRLISYLANDRKVHTSYLSLTRGDGGQNLIGPEIGDLLGVIRTQELLQARRTDHGHQWFTRAVDFGYSKTPDETLRIWNKDEVLSDVIRTIRRVQPDVIINRFMSTPTPGNHGHHVSSAILSEEAYDLAGRKDVLPDQLATLSPWQPTRMFMNTSWWFYGSREKFEEADKSRMVSVDVGTYDPLTGLSSTEIAAYSRSMHKSQGFGSSPSRGEELEYLDLVKGSMPGNRDIFDGIDITWNRVPGGGPIDGMLRKVEEAYDFSKPYLSVPALLDVRQAIEKLPHSLWRDRKLADIENILVEASGLYLEAVAKAYAVATGDSVMVTLEAICRTPVDVTLAGTSAEPSSKDMLFSGTLASNQKQTAERMFLIGNAESTAPYWLTSAPEKGLYHVDDPALRGYPETPRKTGVIFHLVIQGQELDVPVPLVYKSTDPVDGEVYRPFDVVPVAFVNLSSPVYLLQADQPSTVSATIKSNTDQVEGTVRVLLPDGWKADPAEQKITLNNSGEEALVSFAVSAPGGPEEGTIAIEFVTNKGKADQMATEINYDHIPAQLVLREASAKGVRMDLKRGGSNIAYIEGAGDGIVASLQQVGYHVDVLKADDITDALMLRKYDAVVLGIRAYNTVDRLPYIQKHLFQYVEEGGTLITQYNTSQRLSGVTLAPFPLELSRLRVTDEHAEVKFLAPDHRVMNTPNKITQKDFDGWVQERGLYYPETWDPAFTPIFSMSDEGESPLEGSMLIAESGKGYFVYTGLSFFRQLPDGVPGAYRLFANLLALSQKNRS